MRLGNTCIISGRLDMAKPLLNGGGSISVVDASDDDATTMAVIQDHIASCAKMQDGTYSIKEERFSCDFDHMYAMAEHDSAAAVMEVRHLKELLLLHLDLIQQQSDQIVNRDKQLQNLRQENEMLRQRLERMDRRVTLHHNKRSSAELPAGPILNLTGESSEESPTIFCEQRITDIMQPFPKIEGSPSPRGSPLTIGSKLHHLVLPEVKTSRSRKSSWSSDTGTAHSRRSVGSDRGRDSSARTESPAVTIPTSKRSKTSQTQTSQNRRQTIETEVVSPYLPVAEVVETVVREIVRRPRVASSVAALKTPILYYCPADVQENNSKFEEEEEEEEESSAQSLLEVPRWRIKHYTSCYSMEGTENLEDEVFMKRHQRLELDERRRKRWDIQRLREQRQYEKLKQRQSQQGAGGSRKSSSAVRRRSPPQDVTQLWPDPENLQFIEVDEFLPVTAFGVPVPAFLPMVFELPWVTEVSLDPVNIKQERDSPVPPLSPDLPPPPPPQSQAQSSRSNPARRRSKTGTFERRRASTRRR